jgi:nitrous oxidase accessory protein NosD
MLMKRNAIALLLVLALVVSAVAGIWLLKAPLHKTITVPDDYLTIQEAVDHASAGDTVFVKKGTYYCGFDNVVILKSLSLVGEDANATILDGQLEMVKYHIGGLGGLSTVIIGASNVLITGFNITNGENAITISQNVSGIRIVGNNLMGNMVGISDADNSRDNGLVVSGNNITNNSVTGLRLTSSNNVVSNNLFSDNNQALSMYYGDNVTVCYNRIVNNSRGVTLAEVSGASIFGNNITGSVGYDSSIDDYGYGIEFKSNCNDSLICNNNIWECTHGINVRNVLLASSDTPILQGSGNIVYHNNLFNNSQNANVEHTYPYGVTGVVNGTTIVSWDNGTVGNYWSDYQSKYPNATEIDTSGIGDTPYVIDENNTDYYPLTHAVDVSAEPLSQPLRDPFPTAQVVTVLITSVTITGIGLLVYFKKRKH